MTERRAQRLTGFDPRHRSKTLVEGGSSKEEQHLPYRTWESLGAATPVVVAVVEATEAESPCSRRTGAWLDPYAEAPSCKGRFPEWLIGRATARHAVGSWFDSSLGDHFVPV